mmetsp:Transcript_7535/g.16485  ORF Transcript_7535/g.16485 Transcript_7535/m.16485 type:complete len:95 (-) Transcript_7535:21-305(-)
MRMWISYNGRAAAGAAAAAAAAAVELVPLQEEVLVAIPHLTSCEGACEGLRMGFIRGREATTYYMSCILALITPLASILHPPVCPHLTSGLQTL